MAQGGVQALEAMLFALDRAAALGLAPPGVVLGAHVLDDCDNDTYGLEMALDFIKGSIRNIDDAEYSCNASARALRKVISGVVGAASSVTSVQVANLLRLFQIPQVRAARAGGVLWCAMRHTMDLFDSIGSNDVGQLLYLAISK
ncbi:Metabotropic glutamate receptor 3 [Operophtera brumata]|uniref:Metabotropic glutamate receptor 3 n=1 Tax=Operophtera brumata TaxID=104452 RepID=A0A0L7KWN8_OPEBR|nr:Metabotropic glutamate receptor 3 [Operophtera brumata]